MNQHQQQQDIKIFPGFRHDLPPVFKKYDSSLIGNPENKAKWISKVHVQAGQLRGIVPEQLQMCWEFVAKETIADKSELCIETIPIEGLCQDCSKTFPVKDYKFECPSCGGGQVETVKGLELQVKDVELAF